MAEDLTRDERERMLSYSINLMALVMPSDSPTNGEFRRHTTPLLGFPRQLWMATWNYNYKEGIRSGCGYLVSNYWSVCGWMGPFFCALVFATTVRSYFNYREDDAEGSLRYAHRTAFLSALLIASLQALTCLLDLIFSINQRLRLWWIDCKLEGFIETHYKENDMSREQNINLIIQAVQSFGSENVDNKTVRMVFARKEYSDENIHDVAAIFANNYCSAPAKEGEDVFFVLVKLKNYFIRKNLPSREYDQLLQKVLSGKSAKLKRWYPGKWIRSYTAPCLCALMLALLLFATQDSLKSWGDVVRELESSGIPILLPSFLMPLVAVIFNI
ncbi:uncharacterized protein CXQ87_003462 [Candidozyma duobushaemuli]|uniref:Uncharacterized protein n=2 Tax=Candidozyma TaxID=3303203 RepID=A0ABX8IDJ8_9ASCO|nr:uncharacterized protein CXQ87_003462 [[Candida] duobushaemulonis]PVH15616.1 hypothetical protein CXQ87_003462 [[Candida] duobushaemulonis]QWU88811.1 hypothetical protein CA3LBN_003119 [[Candida] haemuloni]